MAMRTSLPFGTLNQRKAGPQGRMERKKHENRVLLRARQDWGSVFLILHIAGLRFLVETKRRVGGVVDSFIDHFDVNLRRRQSSRERGEGQPDAAEREMDDGHVAAVHSRNTLPPGHTTAAKKSWSATGALILATVGTPDYVTSTPPTAAAAIPGRCRRHPPGNAQSVHSGLAASAEAPPHDNERPGTSQRLGDGLSSRMPQPRRQRQESPSLRTDGGRLDELLRRGPRTAADSVAAAVALHDAVATEASDYGPRHSLSRTGLRPAVTRKHVAAVRGGETPATLTAAQQPPPRASSPPRDALPDGSTFDEPLASFLPTLRRPQPLPQKGDDAANINAPRQAPMTGGNRLRADSSNRCDVSSAFRSVSLAAGYLSEVLYHKVPHNSAEAADASRMPGASQRQPHSSPPPSRGRTVPNLSSPSHDDTCRSPHRQEHHHHHHPTAVTHSHSSASFINTVRLGLGHLLHEIDASRQAVQTLVDDHVDRWKLAERASTDAARKQQERYIESLERELEAYRDERRRLTELIRPPYPTPAAVIHAAVTDALANADTIRRRSYVDQSTQEPALESDAPACRRAKSVSDMASATGAFVTDDLRVALGSLLQRPDDIDALLKRHPPILTYTGGQVPWQTQLRLSTSQPSLPVASRQQGGRLRHVPNTSRVPSSVR